MKKLFVKSKIVTKNLFRELRRVRWLKERKAANIFLMSIFFIVLGALFLFGVMYGFTELWNKLGVGINAK